MGERKTFWVLLKQTKGRTQHRTKIRKNKKRYANGESKKCMDFANTTTMGGLEQTHRNLEKREARTWQAKVENTYVATELK